MGGGADGRGEAVDGSGRAVLSTDFANRLRRVVSRAVTTVAETWLALTIRGVHGSCHTITQVKTQLHVEGAGRCGTLPPGEYAADVSFARLLHGPDREVRTGWRRAFTRCDLLVMIATVSVLAGAMGLAASRPRAAGSVAVCQNNLRRLMTAWLLYAEDNRGRVARNYTIPGVDWALANKTNYPWAPNLMTWDTQAGNTNEELARLSSLAPYVGLARGEDMPFHCPADTYLSPAQRALGWSHRNRSYSMNGFVGDWWIDTAERPAPETSFVSSQYRQFLRINTFPDPARCFVLLEEHPDSINCGFFENMPNVPVYNHWEDIPASFHNGSLHVTFADGHVERHWWASAKCTIWPVRYTYLGPPSFDEAGRKDYEWLMGQAAVRMDGSKP